MAAALTIKGMDFAYPGKALVLKEFNRTINAGEKVGIIGPNGAGKTTLFLLITGILQATAGQLEVFNQPVKPGVFNPAVGMVFQHTADQLICPSVSEDIAFGPQNIGLDKEAIRQRVTETAKLTGITALLDRPPHHLSGGEQRLVALSGILAMHPRLLIMDEPTSDLDMRYRRRLIQLLERMTGKTLLIASHDLEFILETCHRVLLLENGRIQADGQPALVMGDRRLMEAHGLELPHSLSAGWHRHK